MKKTLLSSLLAVMGLLLVACGGGGNTPAPVSQRIAKIWTASKVEANATTVYTKGQTQPANIEPRYSAFRLNLSNPTTVQLTDVDGNTFTGTWTTTDTQLTLTGLTPQPTGTNGTITFTIGPLTDTQLVLTRTSASQKTGNSINKYTLSNP